jgi:hypothetical protein
MTTRDLAGGAMTSAVSGDPPARPAPAVLVVAIGSG